jgi:hypothetical protein
MKTTITGRALAAAAALILLSACGIKAAERTPAPPEPSAALPQVTVPAATALSPAPSATGQAQDMATPTARAGLEATDPTGVNLASGKPTLVEFFAFW